MLVKEYTFVRVGTSKIGKIFQNGVCMFVYKTYIDAYLRLFRRLSIDIGSQVEFNLMSKQNII